MSDRKPNTQDVLLSERLRQSRRRKGLTQKELAEGVGVRYQQIQKYETCQCRISVGMLHSISKALEVPIAVLLRGFGH